MKKFVLLVAVFLAAIPAFAQLNVKASAKSKNIASIRMGVIRVSSSDAGFFLSMTTDNQFDRPGVFFLGADKESATATVDGMLAILAENDTDAMTTVECSPGVECNLYVKTQLGVPVLWFKFDGCAGRQGLSKGELERVKAAVNK